MIGVFDSGVGGISVLAEAVRLLPGEHFLYFGDSANAPYGSKPEAWVRERSLEITKMLLAEGASAILIACNTATAAAAKTIRELYPDVPVIGVEPALKVAVRDHENRAGKDDPDRCPQNEKRAKYLVMATAMTLQLEKYHALEQRLACEADFIPIACVGLAKRIEEGRLEDADLYELLEELIGDYRGKVDGVVLGCTHYPMIRRQIRKVLGPVPLYEGGEGTARELARRVREAGGVRKAGKVREAGEAREAGKVREAGEAGEAGITPEEGARTGSVQFRSSKNTEEELALYREFFDHYETAADFAESME